MKILFGEISFSHLIHITMIVCSHYLGNSSIKYEQFVRFCGILFMFTYRSLSIYLQVFLCGYAV